MTILLLGLALLGAGDALPGFEQFKVQGKYSGKPAAPILSTRTQRNFRTVIREEAASGPNFAGHYTLAEWGCGAGCVSLAVVDSATGRTFDGPFSILGYDLAYVYEGGEEQLEFRIDSRLVIARGCPGEKDCGTYYYEWADERFKLLRKTPATKKAALSGFAEVAE
jgi:hypothetical protein